MSLRPYPLDANQASWLATAGAAINRNHLIAGNGISLNRTPSGVQISATQTRHINYLTNKGYYNFNTEYWPGDVIFVDPSKTYKDQTGADITNIADGGFICNTYIPPSTNDSNYFLSAVVPALTGNGGQATDIIANTFRWYQQNTYYPVSNPPSASSMHVLSGYNIYASQSFWQPIGGVGTVTYADYDENAAYSKGTIVWVDPMKHYSRSFFETGSGNQPPLSAGAFFTNIDVPAAVSGSRPSGNYFFPFYPTFDPSASVTVSGSTFNEIFFKPIMPLSPQTFCTANGDTYSGFGVFIVTGSAFDFALPYS
jgi:hypothetical protein